MARTHTKPTGRPRISCDDLVENWEELALDGYASGMSDVEIRKLLARPGFRILGNSTWEKLLKDQHFAETIKKGQVLSQAWWEEHGRKGLLNQKFNSTLWYMNMKNRFKWKDKQPEEVPQIVSQTSTPSDPSQILDILERFGKK